MSLAVALVGKDGIVVASDTREIVTLGDLTFPQDDVAKLKTISDAVVLTALGNLAGYCNYLVSYFVSKELLPEPKTDTQDIESFAHNFSKWASGEYRQATQGMSPVLLNSLSNRIEIMVVGYKKDATPQIYVISNDATQPALVPHLLDIPYHISGVASVGTYWIKETANLRPIKEMSVETLKTLPLLMIRETAKTSSAVSLPMDMVILKPNQPIQQVGKDEIVQIESSLDDNMKIGDSLRRLLNGI